MKKRKEYAYQPMNAIEFFLCEIARNTEEMVELLKVQKQPIDVKDETITLVVKEEVKVEEPIVEEKPTPKRTRRKRTTTEG